MTETEKKALALLNAVCAEWEVGPATEDDMDGSACFAALTRAIEQHEAFRQEVSDAVERVFDECEEHIPFAPKQKLRSFIIAKPDPLVEALNDLYPETSGNREYAEKIRAAIKARGGRIVWEGE